MGPSDSSLMEQVPAGGSLHVLPSLYSGAQRGHCAGRLVWRRGDWGQASKETCVHYCPALASSQGVGGCQTARGKRQVYMAVVLMPLCFNRSAPLFPQPQVRKMPILEKAPQKMAAKTLSSEEEMVSNFWSSLSFPYTPHSHTFGFQNSPEWDLPSAPAGP